MGAWSGSVGWASGGVGGGSGGGRGVGGGVVPVGDGSVLSHWCVVKLLVGVWMRW